MNCKKCDKDKPLDQFPKYRGKTGRILYRGKCKDCFNAEHLDRVYGNPEQRDRKAVRDAKWRSGNPGKVKTYRAMQRQNIRRYHQDQREYLTDRYIINRLGFSVHDNVPTELIEAKRWQIKIQRLLEEIGYEKHCRVAGRFS